MSIGLAIVGLIVIVAVVTIGIVILRAVFSISRIVDLLTKIEIHTRRTEETMDTVEIRKAL